jgi:hypothetical protein
LSVAKQGEEIYLYRDQSCIESKAVQKYLQRTVQRRSEKETSDLFFVTDAFVLLID